MITKRDFGLFAAGLAATVAAPIGARAAGAPTSTANRSMVAGVNFGVQSGTFGLVPIEEVIAGVTQAGFGLCEIHPRNVEPLFPAVRRQRGVALTPEQETIVKYSREQQRAWRLSVPLDYYRDIGRRFREAGVQLPTYSFLYGGVSDEEMDRSFEMAKALGAGVVTAVGPWEMMPKLDGMARAHGVRLAVHNEGGISSVAQFDQLLKGLSDDAGVCFDIGHFLANGGDPLEMLNKHRDRILVMHIKDRKKDNGPPVLFGEGDTPVIQVLRWMRDNRFAAPAHVEQEIPGWDRLAIARHDLDYCRKALT